MTKLRALDLQLQAIISQTKDIKTVLYTKGSFINSPLNNRIAVDVPGKEVKIEGCY